ncbi:response regulator transcription factor [Desulfosporosinus sp. SB140]|uniref:response regulator transcription factor n=1 Tax=Desulfosporosinus paludis TaxID=3115649 RepID=UPI00388DC5A0
MEKRFSPGVSFIRILVMNDGQRFDQRLFHLIIENGYAADMANDEDSGIEMALTRIYDVVILEQTIPPTGELSLLEKIRSYELDTPILMITAKNIPKDRVRALDAGADDCLSRPFLDEELLARIRSVARRKSKELVNPVIVIKGLTLDILKREIQHGNDVFRLSNKEALILELLMRNYGNVVAKETIYFKVWGLNSEASMSNVDLFIHYLRKKLRIPLIKTVRNIGYLLQHEEIQNS